MNALSTEATNFGWLLDNFDRTVPGTRHTLVVSADGLLMAMSDHLDRTSGDQLAAIVAGMSSLTRGASRQLNGGAVRQAIIEMDNGFLFLMNVSNGSVLAAVADSTCDVGLIGFDDAVWAQAVEPPLSVIAQPAYEMGVAAAKLLVDRIRNGAQDEPQTLIMSTTMIVRGSSRRARTRAGSGTADALPR